MEGPEAAELHLTVAIGVICGWLSSFRSSLERQGIQRWLVPGTPVEQTHLHSIGIEHRPDLHQLQRVWAVVLNLFASGTPEGCPWNARASNEGVGGLLSWNASGEPLERRGNRRRCRRYSLERQGGSHGTPWRGVSAMSATVPLPLSASLVFSRTPTSAFPLWVWLVRPPWNAKGPVPAAKSVTKRP